MPTLTPMSTLAPMPTLAPLATLKASGVVDCTANALTGMKAGCLWSSSTSNRTDPRMNMTCPENHTKVWKDEKTRRTFRCLENSKIQNEASVETDACKISNPEYKAACSSAFYYSK